MFCPLRSTSFLLFVAALGATACRSSNVAVEAAPLAIAPDLDEATFASRYASLEPEGEARLIDGEHSAYVVIGDPEHVPGRDRSELEEQLVVVLLHGRSGLTDFERRWADRLSKLGYGVIVPDLGADNQAMGAPTTPAEFESITAAIHYARSALPMRARQVVLVGFDDGAAHALRAAKMDDHVEAVVAIAPPAEAPIPDDHRVLVFDVVEGDGTNSELIQRVEVEAGHGFAQPDRADYDAEAADHAWRLVSAFIDDIYDPYLAVRTNP